MCGVRLRPLLGMVATWSLGVVCLTWQHWLAWPVGLVCVVGFCCCVGATMEERL